MWAKRGGWGGSRKHRKPRRRKRRLFFEGLERRELLANDILYLGDAFSNSVERFDAINGAYLGSFVAPESAGLHGPRGMVFDQGSLLVVNQNINLPKNGEVLRYNGQTGAPAGALVPFANSDAPFSPAGIVVRDNIAYVADTREDSSAGRVAKYNATTGSFLGELQPQGFLPEFRPRGLVFGPDGRLYVTVSSIAETGSSDPPGYVLSFDIATGDYRMFAWNDGDGQPEAVQGEAIDLHNPVGIAFAPDGLLYVTSNRPDPVVTGADANTRIVILDPITGNERSYFDLDPHTNPEKNPTRLFAQSMVFGPAGKLFIPVLVESLSDGGSSGAILSYDPTTQETATFFASTPDVQSIVVPTYVTFGHTDPATLSYLSADPAQLSSIETFPLVLDGPLSVGHLYGGSSGLGGRVSDFIQVSDSDDTVTGATIRITGNYHSDQDRLQFTNQGAITGQWDAATGTLTLSGRDRADAYRSALQNVFYANTKISANLDRRTVSFTVHDSLSASNTVTRDIVLVKDDLNALFYTTRFVAAQRNFDALFRLDSATGLQSFPFIVPGHEEGGMLLVGGQTLLAVGRKVAPVEGEAEEGSFFGGSAARGTVLRYPPTGDTSDYGTVVVADTSANAPVDPEGIVLDGNTLYIADTRLSQPASGPIPSGRIRRYNATTGEFLNDITASGFNGLFHPRGLVFGPDGSLYVSLYDPNVDAAGALVNPGYGAILKIDSVSSAPVVVAFNNGDGVQDAGETRDLHSPGSLAFGPGGKLYVTTRSTSADGLDKIVVLNPASAFAQVDHVDLARVDDVPLHPRALLFGPGGKLFVSVNEPDNPDPFTNTRGYLRSYNVATKEFSVAASATAGPIGYFTFGNTNPKTLAFELPAGSAPVLDGTEGTAVDYSADSPAAQVTATLGVSDSDSGELTGAQVFVSANYQELHDVLTFANTTKITGVWDGTFGKLRLVGTDTVANYQAALRSVKFQSKTYPQTSGADISPLPTTRTVSFFVSDGEHSSNVVTRDIRVSVPRGDYLFVGDQGDPNDPTDDSVQRFEISNFSSLGTFVAPGQLIGPRGMLFNAGNLLVVNQNVDQPFAGEVLRFNGKTGSSLTPVVSKTNPQAPFAPRGMVVKDGILYAADFEGTPTPRIAKYNAATGAFIGNLVPVGFSGEFRPRGLVFGPDGNLYVSVFSETAYESQDAPGYILKFTNTTTGAFEIVAANNGDGVHPRGEIADLHNPEGLVFGPDGRLYVTSFIVNSADNKILVLDVATKTQRDSIPLGQYFAQAMLFGPNDKLFVPITGGGSEAGSVRLYDVATKDFSTLNGKLQQPWYLTFTQTNPATLAYEPWHNFVNPLDVDGDGNVVPLDVLIVINEINAPTNSDALGLLPRSRPPGNFYFDVNQDGFVAPIDALNVINYLIDQPQAEGEARSRSPLVSPAIPDTAWPTVAINSISTRRLSHPALSAPVFPTATSVADVNPQSDSPRQPVSLVGTRSAEVVATRPRSVESPPDISHAKPATVSTDGGAHPLSAAFWRQLLGTRKHPRPRPGGNVS
jgi:glucose/arabinose dehydrogenase